MAKLSEQRVGFLPPSKTPFLGNRPPQIARENSATLDNYAIVAQKAEGSEGETGAERLDGRRR